MDIDEVRLEKGVSVLNVNRSRQRAVYYRQVGNDWVKTSPLPADPFSISYYFSKGFKAKPPDKVKIDDGVATTVIPSVEKPKSGLLLCPFCDYEPASPIALRSHLRKHITKTKKEKNEEK